MHCSLAHIEALGKPRRLGPITAFVNENKYTQSPLFVQNRTPAWRGTYLPFPVQKVPLLYCDVKYKRNTLWIEFKHSLLQSHLESFQLACIVFAARWVEWVTMRHRTAYRKPQWGLAHASDFWLENPLELYVDKTQTAKVVLKSTWCRFYLKVQQRWAHDVSQVRRCPIFYTGRHRERSG